MLLVKPMISWKACSSMGSYLQITQDYRLFQINKMIKMTIRIVALRVMKKKLLIILVKIVGLDFANTTVEWTNRLKKVKDFH